MANVYPTEAENKVVESLMNTVDLFREIAETLLAMLTKFIDSWKQAPKGAVKAMEEEDFLGEYADNY